MDARFSPVHCRPTLFFNSILRLGYFSAEWSVGLIQPLHNKGGVNCVEEIRGDYVGMLVRWENFLLEY